MRVLRYLRNNTIAIIALVIALGGTGAYAANTIRSTDIVDGSVKGVDIAANAVGPKKVVDDSLTGADIKESSLGEVPHASNADTATGADKLGGVAAKEFRQGSSMGFQRVDSCAQTGIWMYCAPVTLTVPAGERYRVRVTSAGSVWGSVNGGGLYCAAYEGPSCITNYPVGASFVAGQYTTIASVGTMNLGPGTHTLCMALRADVAVGVSATAVVTTMVEWTRSGTESVG